MAFIDVVEWNDQQFVDQNTKNPQYSNPYNRIYAHKFPHNNLSTATQLIVRESQEAVLFSKGKILGKFGPGKHQLTTENLPLLRNLYGIPFGGKNPFTAEVWFVNKTSPMDIDWTTNTMRYKDPEYGQMMPLYAKGRYGLKVKDAERFLIELVGTLENFTAANITEHFQGELVTKTNSFIISYMTANGLGINSISACLDELSQFLKQKLSDFWNEYGFNLTGFNVTEINLDTSTDEGKKISEAMSDRSAQAIAGYTWQQRQSFDAINNASINSGGGMGILGVGMMAGVFNRGGGNGVLQVPGQGTYQMPMGQNQGQVNDGNQKQVPKMVFCHKCGRSHSSDSLFCPHCGSKYNPCPACGADNYEDASRCVKCGTYLKLNNVPTGLECPRCHNPYAPGTKFCPKCGNKLS